MDEKKKILVVEDAEFIRKFLSEQLKKDYEVETANDGKDGVKKFREFHPDVVFMDINMPKMHGVDALKRIMEIDGEAKVAMLTVEDNPEVMEDCKRFGAFEYIIKPFAVDSIYQAIYMAI
ncbi:MAG: response regulator [Lachnospiraceae bacterium]|nr:response regulator [Lachnospiraceae bacterium]